jgi:hypothetical protein
MRPPGARGRGGSSRAVDGVLRTPRARSRAGLCGGGGSRRDPVRDRGSLRARLARLDRAGRGRRGLESGRPWRVRHRRSSRETARESRSSSVRSGQSSRPCAAGIRDGSGTMPFGVASAGLRAGENGQTSRRFSGGLQRRIAPRASLRPRTCPRERSRFACITVSSCVMHSLSSIVILSSGGCGAGSPRSTRCAQR